MAACVARGFAMCGTMTLVTVTLPDLCVLNLLRV